MNEQLKEYIETVIIPQYESFDKAHNLMHVKYCNSRKPGTC